MIKNSISNMHAPYLLAWNSTKKRISWLVLLRERLAPILKYEWKKKDGEGNVFSIVSHFHSLFQFFFSLKTFFTSYHLFLPFLIVFVWETIVRVSENLMRAYIFVWVMLVVLLFKKSKRKSFMANHTRAHFFLQ